MIEGKVKSMNGIKYANEEVNINFIPDGIYVGPDRRADRRRERSNIKVQAQIKNFGLDKRIRLERRSGSSSYLLTSNA